MGFSWSSINSVWVMLILLAVIGATRVKASPLDVTGATLVNGSKHCQYLVAAPKEAETLSLAGDSIFNQSAHTPNFVSDLWQTEREDMFKFKGRLFVESKRYGAVAMNRRFLRPPSHYDRFYEYTRLDDARRVCSVKNPQVLYTNNKHILNSLCNLDWLKRPLDVVWNSECRGRDCSPFNVSQRESLPNSVFLEKLECTPQGQGKGQEQVLGYFRFSNVWNSGFRFTLPETTILIGEGEWDGARGQLCMVACSIQNGGRVLSEEDCGISISMQFPTALTVVDRYMVVGHVESQSGNFKNFTFKGPTGMDRGMGMGRITTLPIFQYKYTKLDQVEKVCNKTFTDSEMAASASVIRRLYPDGSSFGDLGFDVAVENSAGNWRMQGHGYPFTIGNRYERDLQLRATNPGGGPLNVSFNLKFEMPFGPKSQEAANAASFEHLSPISAEGIYNPLTGSLCMVGCRSSTGSGDNHIDCQIHIKVKYANSLNPDQYISGSITSLRSQEDPHYFKPMKLSSTRDLQVQNGMWRNDLEIIMGLVSLSLTAVVIYTQLLHIKRHPNVLPFVSFLTHTALALGHLIPLLLNFEAFFMNGHKAGKLNALQFGGGWLEMNQVVVPVMTIVVFLLQLRLLQLVWTAKLAVAGAKTAWFWETNVLCIAFGALIAFLLFHLSGASSHSNSTHFMIPKNNNNQGLLQDFRAYAGVILDGFLLPQVLVNFFSDTKMIILVPYFYIGITLVRSIPHVYDACRVIPYFYANPDSFMNFYSTASLDYYIVIHFGALLLALIVFLQQRFGGRCIAPSKFKKIL